MSNSVKLLSFLRIRRKLTEKNISLAGNVLRLHAIYFLVKSPMLEAQHGGFLLGGIYSFSTNRHEVRRLINFHIIN